MTEAEIYPTLTTVFHDVFLRDDIVLTPEMTAKDVDGWDSFKQIEIIMAAEKEFQIHLTPREIDNLSCVGDLVSVIAKKAV